ncbi:reverse transcriptase [Senna tora]|uniref:Reverse transcriptase n=1 Tax=Senna tora TaxID=362788 RepID=A0A834TDS8_9FABA|nr:reverse transcriptase [Senna tora]
MEKIWRFKGSQRIRVFLWSLAHDSIMTDNQRMRRCFTDSDICKRCGQAAKTTLHAIRDCPCVSGLWRTRKGTLDGTPSSKDFAQADKIRNMGLSNSSPSEVSTYDWLARNENGNWLFGFAKHLLKGCVDHVEIWSIFFGIITGWEKGFKHVVVESDNRNVINLICNGYDGPHPLRNILSRIRELLNRDWHVKIKHVFREGNMVADCLARYAHSIPPGFLMFNSPPSFCNSLL